jgi:hypothetical protein
MRTLEIVIFKPRRIRWVAGVIAGAVVVLFTVLSFGLHGPTGNGPGVFQRGDQIAMIGLGVLLGLGILRRRHTNDEFIAVAQRDDRGVVASARSRADRPGRDDVSPGDGRGRERG